jgi:ribosomal protein S18 acetylase RimI-like enzyme
MGEFAVRRLVSGDQAAAELLLHRDLGGGYQARLGELHDVLARPGFAAWEQSRLLGVATYLPAGGRAQLAALCVAADRRRSGIGGTLLEAVADAVSSRGALELWLVTTNDNLDALRLYQRHGFRLAELRVGAVERARELTPQIPLVGEYGIPIRDELVLVRPLA